MRERTLIQRERIVTRDDTQLTPPSLAHNTALPPLNDRDFVDPRAFGLFKAAYSVSETLTVLSIGRTKFYELVQQGDLKITKLGTKSLVCVIEIVALLNKLRCSKDAETTDRAHKSQK